MFAGNFAILTTIITFQEFLEDESIMKVGVGPHEDSCHLNADYGLKVRSSISVLMSYYLKIIYIPIIYTYLFPVLEVRSIVSQMIKPYCTTRF